eukprot:8904537-Ditylum_brightwellii.AAC.1
MSLSTLCGNFKLHAGERGKVHKQPTILFVPEGESMGELYKVEITLQVSPNATGGDTQDNVTKNKIANLRWRTWSS